MHCVLNLETLHAPPVDRYTTGLHRFASARNALLGRWEGDLLREIELERDAAGVFQLVIIQCTGAIFLLCASERTFALPILRYTSSRDGRLLLIRLWLQPRHRFKVFGQHEGDRLVFAGVVERRSSMEIGDTGVPSRKTG